MMVTLLTPRFACIPAGPRVNGMPLSQFNFNRWSARRGLALVAAYRVCGPT